MNRVSTVLGDSKPVTRTYEDGSVDCPYCSYPIITPKERCENPCCEAHPAWTPEALSAWREKRRTALERIAREEANRKSVAEFAKQRHDEHQAWVAAQIEEAKKRGSCLNCLFQSGWERSKFIKHRGECPKAR